MIARRVVAGFLLVSGLVASTATAATAAKVNQASTIGGLTVRPTQGTSYPDQPDGRPSAFEITVTLKNATNKTVTVPRFGVRCAGNATLRPWLPTSSVKPGSKIQPHTVKIATLDIKRRGPCTKPVLVFTGTGNADGKTVSYPLPGLL